MRWPVPSLRLMVNLRATFLGSNDRQDFANLLDESWSSILLLENFPAPTLRSSSRFLLVLLSGITKGLFLQNLISLTPSEIFHTLLALDLNNSQVLD